MLNLNHNDILSKKRIRVDRLSLDRQDECLLFIPLRVFGELEADDDNVELAGGGGESEERRRMNTAFV